MTFTIEQITLAYKDYKLRRVMRVQKGGKWTWFELKGQGIPRLEATKAEVKNMSDVVDFPTFLKEHYGKTN